MGCDPKDNLKGLTPLLMAHSVPCAGGCAVRKKKNSIRKGFGPFTDPAPGLGARWIYQISVCRKKVQPVFKPCRITV